jgi:hypothetical protein
MGSGIIAPSVLTSTLNGGKWSDTRSGFFTPWEITRGTHWIGGWLGPRSGLDAVGRQKSGPCRDSNPDCHYTD